MLAKTTTPDYTQAIIQALTDRYHYNARQKRAWSPFRKESDDLSMTVTPIPDAPGGGVWHDHPAGRGGTFIELAKELGIYDTMHDTESAATPAQVISCLADYAAAHGVSEQVFLDAGWYDTIYMGRKAIAIPTRKGIRHRMLEGVKELGKYRSPKGYVQCWYGLERALAKVVDGQPLVICNGEASVVVAQAAGLAATCQTAGEKALTPENLAELADGTGATHSGYPRELDVFIAFDCDDAGRTHAGTVRHQMRAAGFTAVRAVDLNGGHHFDLADFVRLHQADSLAALQALADLPERSDGLVVIPVAAPDIVTRQARRITELEQQLQARSEMIEWILAMLRNKSLPTGQRITAIAAYIEVNGQRAKHQLEADAAVPVRVAVIAEESGQSAHTVSAHIQRLEKAGVWDRKVVTTYNNETQEIRREIQLTPAPVLARPLEIQRDPELKPWGGRRTCADCGSDDLIRITTVVCRTCGCKQEETIMALNDDAYTNRIAPPEAGVYTKLFDVTPQEYAALFDAAPEEEADDEQGQEGPATPAEPVQDGPDDGAADRSDGAPADRDDGPEDGVEATGSYWDLMAGAGAD